MKSDTVDLRSKVIEMRDRAFELVTDGKALTPEERDYILFSIEAYQFFNRNEDEIVKEIRAKLK